MVVVPTVELADGCSVHYEDSEGSGPAVILAHGFLMDTRSFEDLVAGVPGYRWIRWDLRGHGRTRGAGTQYSFWDQARDGLTVLDHLGVERAVMGGHSQGGFTALRMALLEPARCAGLLVFGASDLAYAQEQHETYSQVFAQWNPGTPENKVLETMLAATMIGGDLELQRGWRRRWAENANEDFPSATECLVDVDDISSLTPTLDVPSLIVRGAADQAFTAEDVAALGSRLGARVETIVDATHGAHMTKPEIVNALVEEWLSGLDRTLTTA